MNVSDSERIAGFLELHKLKPVNDINKATIVVFNTCGVRQSAENRVYGLVHNLRKANSKVKIILTGCLANRKDVQRKLKNKVDLFFPISKFEKFENWIIENCLPAQGWSASGGKIDNCKLKIPARSDNTGCSNYLSITPKYTNPAQAFVPVMTGCNNFCSYCVVPYARGQETSRPADDILSEIKELIKKGCKEIILLGQNVNSYHDGKIDFSALLKQVDAIPGLFWIWFVSSHPKDFTDELITTITKCQKVCECVHLPVQAGDDNVLKKMNRGYSAKHYLGLVDKIKKAFKKHKPGMPYSIASDIIVGFPGETKKQFMESARVMEKTGYDMVYFGQFSPRPGTAAFKMKDNVAKHEKKRREKYLNEILKKTACQNNQKYLDKTLEIIVEKEKNGFYFGRTRTMKNVKFPSKKNLIGKFAKIKITKANIWSLEGEVA